MKNGTVWAGVVIVVLIILGGWWYFSQKANEEPALQDTPEVAGESEENEFVDDSKDSAPAHPPVSAMTVRYTNDGFSPATLTVKKGTRVTFVNESADEMWVGSSEHPTHTEYDGTTKSEHCNDGIPSTTSFDQCAVGTTYSFTFDKVGSWEYHNHTSSGEKGTIVVTE